MKIAALLFQSCQNTPFAACGHSWPCLAISLASYYLFYIDILSEHFRDQLVTIDAFDQCSGIVVACDV